MSTVARSQAILLGAQVARLALSLAVTTLLGRSLAPGAFGYFAFVASLFVVSQDVLDMGTTSLATRNVARHPQTERAMLSALLGLRRLVAVGLALACVLIAFAQSGRTLPERCTLFAAAAGIFALHLGAYQVAFQVRQRLGRPMLLGLAAQAAFLAACFVALRLGATVALIGALVVAREIVQVVGSRLLAVPLLGYRLRSRWLDPAIGRLLRDARVFGVTTLFHKLAFSAGTFFLWTSSTPEALGSYSAAQRLIVPLVDVVWLCAIPLIAAFSICAVRSPQALASHVRAFYWLAAGTAATVAVCGLATAPRLLELVYGQTYVSGSASAVAAFRWLTVALACAIVVPVLVVAALARQQERALLRVSGAALAVALAVNALAVSRLGGEGAAMATCLAQCLAVALLSWSHFARRELRRDLARLLYFAPAALLAALLQALSGRPDLQLATAVALAPVCILSLWFLPEQRACRAALPRGETGPVSSPPLALAAEERS